MNHLGRTPQLYGVAFSLLALAGCGGPSVAPVNGTVSYDGKPVNGGTLTFSPVVMDGAPVPVKSADILPDGSYAIGTENGVDGPRIGRHKVAYAYPEQQIPPDQRQNRPWYMFLGPKESEVEIKAGSNTIDIELIFDQAAWNNR